MMTEFETISNGSEESYREEFLDEVLPLKLSLEMERLDKSLEMELRDKGNQKGWRHLLNTNDDNEYDSGMEINGPGTRSVIDQLPKDLLPQKYLDSPEDPVCILDDTLTYQHGIENPY